MSLQNHSNIKIPKIRINAEHQRQIWLNFSPALFAAIVLLYAFLIYLGFDPDIFEYRPEKFAGYLATVGFFGYVFSNLTLMILLRRSINNDIQSHFWDQLRMSALSAWQMTWTRLISSTILAWMSIFISISLITLAMSMNANMFSFLDHFNPLSLFIVLLLNSWILACLCLWNYLQFNRSQQEWQGNLLQIFLLYILATTFVFPQVFNFKNTAFEYHFSEYLLASSIIFSIYLGLGVWRSMASKLHLQSSNLYWLLATMTLPFILWLYGLIFLQSTLSLLSLIVVIYSYALIISITASDNRLAVIQQGFEYLAQKQYLKAIQTLPIWIILLPIWAIMSFFVQFEHLTDYVSSFIFIGIYIAMILFNVRSSRHFNAITMTLIWFLILRFILAFFV